MSESMQSVEKIPKPQEVKTAVRILWIFMIIGLATSIYTVASSWDVLMAGTQDLDEGAKRFVSIFTGVVMVFSLIVTVGVSALLYYLISKGHNWARIVLLVLFVIGLPFTVISILVSLGVSGLPAFSTISVPMPMVATISTIIHALASAYALFLLFSRPATEWFKAPKENRGL